MGRLPAALPGGSRITDYISVGVVAKTFPAATIHSVLKATDRASIRERDLPAHVVVYFVIALALYMQSSSREVLRCLLEGLQWVLGPSAAIKVPADRASPKRAHGSDGSRCNNCTIKSSGRLRVP